MNKIALFALGATLMSAPAFAFEFNGGSLGLGYSAFTDDDIVAPDTTLSKSMIDGSIEMGFTPMWAAQLDLAFADLDASNIDINNVTLHGIYHMDAATSFGAFIGRDDFDSDNLDLYGLEFRHDMQAISLEGYLGRSKDVGESDVMFGLGGRYAVSDQFGLGLNYDRITSDGSDISTIALGADYAVMPNVLLSAKIGSADLPFTGSETYFGIGVEYTFGPKGGTTFGPRGLTYILPGL
ncbi:porin [Phaeovulum sp.]|uniref:porin n=1 Tax=Phaeovulum sp. TaxID=2934796 RepID=UPI0039E5BB07